MFLLLKKVIVIVTCVAVIFMAACTVETSGDSELHKTEELDEGVAVETEQETEVSEVKEDQDDQEEDRAEKDAEELEDWRITSVDLLVIMAHSEQIMISVSGCVAFASLQDLFNLSNSDVAEFLAVADEGLVSLQAEYLLSKELYIALENPPEMCREEYEGITNLYESYGNAIDDFLAISKYEVQDVYDLSDKTGALLKMIQEYFNNHEDIKSLLNQEQMDIVFPPEPEEAEE